MTSANHHQRLAPLGGTGLADDGWVTLDQVELGQCGLVTEVRAGEAEIEQLQAMGVCVGRRVMLEKTGDPMILKVLGSRIGVSARLAARVMVVPCGGDVFGKS